MRTPRPTAERKRNITPTAIAVTKLFVIPWDSRLKSLEDAREKIDSRPILYIVKTEKTKA